MKITENTKLSEILNTYPDIKNELTTISDRFKMINSPIGKIMIQKATVKEMAGKAALTTEEIIAGLESLIAKHTDK